MAGYPRLIGPIAQSASRDEEGHRTYEITWHVQTELDTDGYLDGPEELMRKWVLPAVGAPYALDNDYDPWAFCTPELTIAPHRDVEEGEPLNDWAITQKWTTKPMTRCNTEEIKNPLLEPFKLSGDFTHEQRSVAVDRFGKPLLHPNYQPITGPLVEQRYSYPTINIEFNSPTLPLSTYVLLINKVNDAPLWGLPARCVRFIDAKWERVLYGVCFYYFKTTYTFEFDIGDENYTGFDKPIPAEGTVALNPQGGDPKNPADYIPVKHGDENVSALLDKDGREVTLELGNSQYIQTPQIAKQGNLLLLGIPPTL